MSTIDFKFFERRAQKFVERRAHETLWWTLEALTCLLEEDSDHFSVKSRRAIRDMVRETLKAWAYLDLDERGAINVNLRLAIQEWVEGGDGVLAYDLAKQLLEELGTPD